MDEILQVAAKQVVNGGITFEQATDMIAEWAELEFIMAPGMKELIEDHLDGAISALEGLQEMAA